MLLTVNYGTSTVPVASGGDGNRIGVAFFFIKFFSYFSFIFLSSPPFFFHFYSFYFSFFLSSPFSLFFLVEMQQEECIFNLTTTLLEWFQKADGKCVTTRIPGLI